MTIDKYLEGLNKLITKLQKCKCPDCTWFPESVHRDELNLFLRQSLTAVVEETRYHQQQDIKSVLVFLEGNESREKIANYIKEYLLKKE